MNIKYTTIYKLMVTIIVSMETYIILLSKSMVVNFILLGVTVICLAVGGALLEISTDGNKTQDMFMDMFNDLFEIRNCSVNNPRESVDIDEVDFCFNGYDKEKTKQAIEYINKVLSNVKVISCGRFGYCLYFVDNTIEMYSNLSMASTITGIGVDRIINVGEYDLFDITDWVYGLLLFENNGYGIVIKYNEEKDEHFACVVDKNCV